MDAYGAEISPLPEEEEEDGSTDIMIPEQIEDAVDDDDDQEVILPEWEGGMTLPQMNLATYLAMKSKNHD